MNFISHKFILLIGLLSFLCLCPLQVQTQEHVTHEIALITNSENQQNNLELVLFDLNNGERYVLSSLPSRYLSWSPTGERLVYEVSVNSLIDGGQTALAIYESETHESRFITSEDGFAFFPRWSPDGKQIAFGCWQGNSRRIGQMDICLYDLETQLTENLTDSQHSEGIPTWSPNSEQLAFSMRDSDDARTDIYILSVESDEIVRLTNDDAIETTVSWSPVDNSLIFVQDDDLWIYSLEEGRKQVLLNDDLVQLHPSWSPDGTQIVFMQLDTEFPNAPDIFLMDIDGGSRINLTQSLFTEAFPAIRPVTEP